MGKSGKFVSTAGVDVQADPDVRFHKSVPTFKDALREKVALEEQRAGFDVVVYRVSYNESESVFYSSLQRDFKLAGTERLFDDEAEPLVPLAYDLFSVPKQGFGSSQSKLSEIVATIDTRSHHGPVGKVKP